MRTIFINNIPVAIDMGKMKKVRKKPIIVSAMQIDEPFAVETLEGVMEGSAGDWLIEGIQGELYPCRDDIFRETYEFVEDKNGQT